MIRFATGACLLAATTVGTMAGESRCVVADPTGTPLNVRTSPNGPILGPIDNGRAVFVMDHATDKRGKAWVYIGDRESRAGVGWVVRGFIVCQ